MIKCPNCADPMAQQSLEAFGALRPVDIDACRRCNLMWFDKSESIRLTPRAVLDLFRYIGECGGVGKPLANHFDCPRCTVALTPTQDLQRNTRFSYWRCRNEHGQLITFHQFLRAKNFIRAPSPTELAALRATVRQVACSQCGAPIDLAKDSACAHCGAAVALIDPDGVAKALQELSANAAARTSTEPGPTRSTLSDAQIDAIFDLARMRPPADDQSPTDLAAIGAAAIGALVGSFFSTH